MSNWTDEYLQMIYDCEQREGKLSDWERNFLSALRENLERDFPLPLSERQLGKLDEVWERVTA